MKNSNKQQLQQILKGVFRGKEGRIIARDAARQAEKKLQHYYKVIQANIRQKLRENI
jgi:hypothetical protein